MKLHQPAALGAALAMLFSAGCKQEQRTITTTPPASVVTTPAPSTPVAPAYPPSDATTAAATESASSSAAPAAPASAPPEPPNPPSITGVAPQAPAPAGPGPAERAGRAIGERVDDATLTAKVKTALLQSPDVKGTHVNVETEKGAVQLSGFVESQTQIDRAVQITQSISGVKEVHNKMSLKSGK